MNVQRSTAGGTPSFRIFKIDMGKTVSISGLTVSNGLVPAMGQNGGGILNDGTLTLTDCNVYGNSAGTTMGFGGGGGIYSVGPSVLNNCKIGGIAAGQPNTSGANGGGITAFGALLMNGGSIVGNSESGIFIGGTASLVGVTVTNNTAQNTGGGIRVSGTPTIANILNCTIANNTAVSGGAAIANALGTVIVINSTVSGNTSDNFGGGVDSFNATQTTLINSTVTNNRSNNGYGGGLRNSGGVLLRNTIVAGNFGGASPSTAPNDVRDLLNTNSSSNLIGTCTNCGLTNGINGNQVGVANPGLGPLADNGGPTLTHALLSGSPAIDAGNNSAVTNPPFTGPPFTDQRSGSFNRIADGDGNCTAIVDIGAYELEILTICNVNPPAGRTSGGQQIGLTGAFAGLSTVTMGGSSASWIYTNGDGDTSSITVTTPAHAVGAVQVDLTPASGSPYSKANAFAYLPTVFTDNTITVGQTTAKAQHILELRQAVDAMRAVAGLSPAAWTDGTLTPGTSIIKAIHIQELRTYLDDAATRLSYSTSPYTDPGLTSGFVIKRIHIEELRQRVRTIAG